MKSIWKYLFAFACVFSAVSLVGEGVVGIDGNSLTSADDLGDIDMEATTIQDLANFIAPGYGEVMEMVNKAPASFGIAYGTCQATSSSVLNATVDGVTTFTPTTGGIIVVSFWGSDTVAAGAKINVNGGTSYPIKFHGAQSAKGYIMSGDTVAFVFTGSSFDVVAIDRMAAPKIYYATCGTARDSATKYVYTLRYSQNIQEDDFVLSVGTLLIVKFTDRSFPNGSSLKVNSNSTVGRVRHLYDNTTYVEESNDNPYWSAGEAVPFVWDGTYWRIIKQMYPIASTAGAGIVSLSTSTNSTESSGVAATPSAVKAVREYVDKAVETRVSSDNVTNLVWDIYLTSHRYFYDAVTETTYRQVIEDDFYKLIAVTNVPPSYEVIKALESSDSE